MEEKKGGKGEEKAGEEKQKGEGEKRREENTGHKKGVRGEGGN